MSSESDFELLRRYVECRSQEAFAGLVSRHAGLVYAAALRQVRDPHGAEDVSQVVFLVLARKAATIGPRTPLSAWLLNTTRYASLDFLEAKGRRARHEMRAGQMAQRKTDEHSDPWDAISPRLDEALSRLSARVRMAVLLRFFEGLSFEEVANRLGITPDAAKQRISRGLGQVRAFLGNRGVILSEAGLATALAAHAVTAPPAHLTGAIVAAAQVAPSAGQLATIKGVITLMAWTKTKMLVAGAAALLVVGGTATIAHHYMFRGSDDVVAVNPSIQVVPAETTGAIAPAAKGPVGVVLGTDGNPLSGVTVTLATQQRQIEVYEAQTRQTEVFEPNARPKVTAVSGADGRFELPPAGENWAIVVAENRGFAQIGAKDFASNPKLVLQPWSRIEGVLQVAGKPLANGRVWVTRLQGQKGVVTLGEVGYDQEVRADSQGHFVVPRVIPGAVWIGPGNATGTRLDRIEVKPGETAAVTLGEAGRPIVGRISGGWRDVQASIMPVPHVPDHPAVWDFTVNPDGSFRIDDVPPGSYRLRISKDRLEVGKPAIWGIATGSLTVTVPPIPGGRSSEPLDIGTIEMHRKSEAATQ